MTEREKLEANIACAKLLGHESYIKRDIAPRGNLNPSVVCVEGSEFDIFTDAEQCLAVVKKLMSLGWYFGMNTNIEPKLGQFFADIIDCYDDVALVMFKTYEQAVAAAAIEVMKDE